MKFTLGQQVMLSETGRPTELATVTRVGRKYVYVKRLSREDRFDGETGRGDHQFGYGNRIVTTEEHQERERRSAVTDGLKRRHNITYIHNNFRQSTDTLENLLAILDHDLAADKTRCNPTTGYHATPHSACILR